MLYKIIVVLAVALVAGCSPTVQTSSNQQGPKESTGAISGMIIGGALANDMAGDSRNKTRSHRSRLQVEIPAEAIQA